VVDARNPYAHPLEVRYLGGLPPASVVTAGFDPLRDEGVAYAERLEDDAVEVTHHHHPGMIPGFFSMLADPRSSGRGTPSRRSRTASRGDSSRGVHPVTDDLLPASRGPPDMTGDPDGDETAEAPEESDADETAEADGGDGREERAGEEGMTYAGAGVDIDASERATAALVSAVGAFEGDFAGLLDIGDRYLALAADGVGTKLLVAEALGDYSTVGIDCIAMNANDLVAAGVTPVAFVDYLAVDDPDDATAEQVGEGLSRGAELAGVHLLGGETAVMPEVVTGLDLAGTCAGLAAPDEPFDGEAREGDVLVGFPSSGIHSNGLTLARKAATERHDYTDPFPGESTGSVGEVLLEPTRIYTDLLPALHAVETHACAHVTGGGWTNLSRMGAFEYDVEAPFDAPPVFEFVRREGNVTDEEMHRTFNMGTGFVASVAPGDADELVERTAEGRVIGRVGAGDSVEIRGLSL
jgi:phosphoribosylformylglycinamidine cyclo-ligase